MAAMLSMATHVAAGNGMAAPSSHVAAASIENAVAAAASASLTSDTGTDADDTDGNDDGNAGKTMPATSATTEDNEAALATRRGLASTRLRTAANMNARASARCCRAATTMAVLVALVALVALTNDSAA